MEIITEEVKRLRAMLIEMQEKIATIENTISKHEEHIKRIALVGQMHNEIIHQLIDNNKELD